jgi:hypothetical protein
MRRTMVGNVAASPALGHHRSLQTAQIVGLLAVIVASQRTWMTSHTSSIVLELSPGRSGTPAGLVVLGACVAALIWAGARWALGQSSTAVPLTAAAVVLLVTIYQGLTVPGSDGVGGGVNRVEGAVWQMALGALVSLAASVAMMRLPPIDHPPSAPRLDRASRSLIGVVALGLCIAGTGSLLPWRRVDAPWIGYTENEVWLGSVLGFATVLTIVFALGLSVIGLKTGRLATGPLEISVFIVAAITAYVFTGLATDDHVTPGPGLWIMAVGTSLAVVTTLMRHRQPRTTRPRDALAPTP